MTPRIPNTVFFSPTTLGAILGIQILWLGVAGAETSPSGTSAEPRSFGAVGVKECAACHSNPSPIYQQLGVTSFVRLTEARQWLERDKHSWAYQLVRPENSQLTRTICENLGWKPNDYQFVSQCLSCHAGVDPKRPVPPASVLQFGVQCESCHGAAGQWTSMENHQQTSWRTKTPEEKQSLGMIDLRSPATCAQVCFSCHIGDIDQNRFVTHDMYAAGHPPLPPVELQTFLDAMPPHWAKISEKPLAPAPNRTPPSEFEEQTKYFTANFGPDAASRTVQKALQRDNHHRTRVAIAGSLVGRQVAMELIRDAASQPSLWGDYALYDCAGCHHELRKPTARPPLPGRTPGRPYPIQWWMAEVPLPKKTDPIGQASSPLDAAFESVPFGQRQSVLTAINQTTVDQATAIKLWQGVERSVITQQQSRGWLNQLLEKRQFELHDFATAQQTGWMVRVVSLELADRDAELRKQLVPLVDELTAHLHLDFAKPRNTSVVGNTPDYWQSVHNHNPQPVQKILSDIRKLLQP